jgi:enterochelin esterase family protein
MRHLPSLVTIGLGMCVAGFAAVPAHAQQDAAKTKEARKEGAPGRGARAFTPLVVSPEVQADRQVTFRLRAPDAKRVTVSGEWGGGPQDLSRGDDGLWTVTVGPLKAEIYGYSFSVDGFQTLDPNNRAVKPMRTPRTSILEVPGEPPLVHEFQNVPHGSVRVHEYRSQALGRNRGLYVYTPPNYDKEPTARYPVLYLFHGSGDTEGTWTAMGRAHLIVDNLLAQKKARPLIIVMPDGHAAPPRPPGSAGGPSRNVADFERDLLEDVVPFVEANYRIRPGAASQAIAGLSMGGGQSLTIGLNHADRFAWVGGFSSAVFDPEGALSPALSDPKATDRALRLVWIACGKDDGLVKRSADLAELLKARGIKNEFQVTEGNHSWPVWRKYLAEFVPRLFDDAS